MSSYGGVELGVQIIGSEIGVKNAFGESIAAADKWAADTEAASLKAARSLELTGLSAKQAAIAWARLGIAAQDAATSTGDAALKMQIASVRAEATIRGLYAKQTATTAAAIAGNERAAMKYETALMGAGRTMTTYLTVPMALLGYESMKLATNFQAAMLRIQTYAGASGAEVARQQANILGNAGVLPQGPIQSAEALYHLESIGIRGPRAFEALKTSALAAGAGMADLTTATTALGGALVAGIKGAQNISEAMAGLVTIAGEGNMTLQDLTDAMGTGLLVKAHNVGVSLREAGAALAVLVDRGIPARRAATYLGTTFALMSAPSKNATAALADMGVNAKVMGEMLLKPNGLLDVLNMLHAGMERVGKARGAADLMAAFGRSRQSTGIQTLVQALDSPVSNYSQKLQQYDKGVADAAKRMSEYQHSAQYAFHTSVSQVESDMIRVGTSALPYVAGGVKDLAGGIDALVKGFDSLPGPIKTVFGLMAGGAVSIGPVLLMAGLALKGYRQLGIVMAKLGPTAEAGAAGADASLAGVGAAAEIATAKVLDLKAALADIPVSGVIGQSESGLIVVGGRNPAGLVSQLSADDAAKLGFQTSEQTIASTGMLAGLRAGAGTAISRLLPGMMFAMGGQMVGGMLQTQFRGTVGADLSNVAQGAGLGAGIGMFFPELGGPVTGAAVGAGIGVLADGIKAITASGPSFSDQMSQMRASIDAFAGAAKLARQDITGLHASMASLQLNKDELIKQIGADRAAVRQSPKSAIARDQLAADLAQLKELNVQLDQYNRKLDQARAHSEALARAHQRHIEKLAESVYRIMSGPVWHDAVNGNTGTDAHYMQLFVQNLRDMGKAAATSDPEMAQVYNRVAQIAAAMRGMITLKRIRIAIEEVIHQETAGPSGPKGPIGTPGGGSGAGAGGAARTVVPLTQAQLVQIAFAQNKYNRKTVEEQIAIDDKRIARLKRKRASGTIDNLQYVNEVSALYQDRQSMEQRLASSGRKSLSNDTLLAKAKEDLQQGMWQKAQTLLHRDLRRLELMKQEATAADERAAIGKQIIRVMTEINSKAAGYQTDLKLQEQMARADALAAAQPGLSSPTALQLRLAEKAKAAAMKAIDAHTLTMQGLIDAWNVVAQANQTIAQAFVGSSRTYARESTDAVADSIKGLTHAQELQLREELAQRDAHRGYRPRGGGADGFVIPETASERHHRHHARQAQQAAHNASRQVGSAASASGGVVINRAEFTIKGVNDVWKLLREIETLTRRRGGQRTGTRR